VLDAAPVPENGPLAVVTALALCVVLVAGAQPALADPSAIRPTTGLEVRVPAM
jgi:hypothetical protein